MKLLSYLSKVGKALQLPIATLPAAALFLRLGTPELLGQVIGVDLAKVFGELGNVMFANLAIIFAAGVAIGIAEDDHGAAVLAGIVMFYSILNVSKYWAKIFTNFDVKKSFNPGVLGGIIAGIIGGEIYNRFKNTTLPKALAFFSGRRFVPLVTLFFGFFVAMIFGATWPIIESWISNFGVWVSSQPQAIAGGTFVTFNRLLIPFGLHHILNSFFWFTINGGDLTNFFKSPQVEGSGVYMVGFFPLMMFALPAIAFAIVAAAKKEKREEIAYMMGSLAIVSFLTGITEPLEFAFLFLAPILFVLYAILSGLIAALTIAVGSLSGFGFSAGFFDLALNWGISTNPLYIIIIGICAAPLFFLLFYWIIKKWDLETPGREKVALASANNASVGSTSKTSSSTRKKSVSNEKWDTEGFIKAFGGRKNIITLDNCATRLRLEVHDSSKIDEPMLKSLGSFGVMKTPKSVQVVIGVEVQSLSELLKKAL